MEKKAKKLETFVTQEFNDQFSGYEIIHPDATNFFVTRGINRYNLEHQIKDKPQWGIIIIKSFQPFDLRLKTFFSTHSKKIQKLVFVEMNYF